MRGRGDSDKIIRNGHRRDVNASGRTRLGKKY